MPLSRAGQVSAQVPNWVVDHRGLTSPGAAGARHRGDLSLPAFRRVSPRAHPHLLCHPVSDTVRTSFSISGGRGGVTLQQLRPLSSRCDRQALLVPSTSKGGHPPGRGNCPRVPSFPSPPPHPSSPVERPETRDACGQSVPECFPSPSPAHICLLGAWLCCGLRVLSDPAVCFGLLIMHVLSLVGGAS